MSKERALLERLVSWYYATGEVPPFKPIVSDAEKLLSEPEPETFQHGFNSGLEFANKQHEITQRDYFAGLAMQGFIAADASLNLDEGVISHKAYSQSDAMLKEREKMNE